MTDPSTPYRDQPAAPAELQPAARKRRSLLWIAGGVSVLALVAPWVRRHTRANEDDAPPSLLDDARTFPRATAELEPAVPLTPLLAADEPERLAVVEPTEGATSVSRGSTLTLRFNRPMVPANRVRRPLTESPLVLTPPVAGTAQWTSRSALTFTPDPSVFDAPHESAISFSPELRSLAGETLSDETERTAVFTGGTQLVVDGSTRRVSAGDPLRLVFEGPVDVSALPRQILAYEVEGGHRGLSFVPQLRGRDEQNRSLVDLTLNRALEPGSHIALAVAPTIFPFDYDSSNTGLVTFEFTPRPHIEGIQCPEHPENAAACEFQGPPGRIVDVEETLRLYSSSLLPAELPEGAVRVTPTVPGLLARTDNNVLSVRADWEPGQVYELRVEGLLDRDSHPLLRFSPLAVRSAGRAPEAHLPSGRWVYEPSERAELPLSGVHVDRGLIRYAPVPEGRELFAALHPATAYPGQTAFAWSDAPLAPLTPAARANRWGRGRYAWLDPSAGRAARMAVVSVEADPQHPQGGATVVQSTDLGITTQVLQRGLLVWVTSLRTANPVDGAEITVANAAGENVAAARTDAQGAAWVPLAINPLDGEIAVRAVRGGDRAVMVVDARTAVQPATLGVSQSGSTRPENQPVASVIADRGAYRPGESMHVKVVVRAVRNEQLVAPPRRAWVRVVLTGPDGGASTVVVRRRLNAVGTVDADFTVSSHAALGEHSIDAFLEGVNDAVGHATVTVAEFRQPSARVDLSVTNADVSEGETLRVHTRAAYLFGAPIARATANYTLTREAVSDFPVRWNQFSFSPEGAAQITGTVDSGELTLDEHGEAEVASRVHLASTVRERETLEVTVRDPSGQQTSAWRAFTVYPSTYEVGVRRGDPWVDRGVAIGPEAVVIGHDGAPAAGRAVTARIVREAWHSYWEWSAHAHDDEAGAQGAFQPRRAQNREVVHQCALTSASEPVRCEWTPDRPGTYLLEVSTTDDQGRTSTASRRVYVAAPGEHPDRDPPGGAITVTPSRREWFVGERAQLAFENPWNDAEALITVQREGVLHTERRRITAGGQVVEFAVTQDMVPNAFPSVVIVRPRAGTPATPDAVDVGAPDVRWGATEISVRPQSASLRVELGVPSGNLAPDTDASVDVDVHGPDGRPIATEVLLYAVDEGTLRLTSYSTPDPTRDLLPRRAALFAFEDLRRNLVSRVDFPQLPGSSGDGPEGTSNTNRDDRQWFDPTPLWQPHLVTNAQGHAHVTFHLPNRATQYRVMALALDANSRVGRASSQITATRPVVLREALPRTLTEGDNFDATVFVHNTSDQALDATLTAIVDGTRRNARTVHLDAGGEARVSEPVTAHNSTTSVRFEVNANGSTDAAERVIVVEPRGHWSRAASVGAVRRDRTVELSFPQPVIASRGESTLTVGSNPFVGLDSAMSSLDAFPYDGAEPLASTLLGWASLASLQAHAHHGRWSAAELRAHAESVISRLEDLQTDSGGIGYWSRATDPSPYLSAYVLHSLAAARAQGWTVPDALMDRLQGYVTSNLEYDAFVDASMTGSMDHLAFALRVLAEVHHAVPARVTAVYEAREHLSTYGLAQLAMAMERSDRRRDALVLVAARRVTYTATPGVHPEPNRLFWFDSSTRTIGAVLEAASQLDVGAPFCREIATQLLHLRTAQGGAAWGTTHETSYALQSLARYAAKFRPDGAMHVTVTLDGQPVAARAQWTDGASFVLPNSVFEGTHQLRVRADDTAFYALESRWATPLGAADTIARGHDIAVHRVLETEAGAPLADGASVHVGDLIRVRLFVYSEVAPPPYLALRSPIGGGFEAVDRGLDTTPRASLDALMGAGPDDSAVDPRAFYAMRSLDQITHRALESGYVDLHLDRANAGLSEFTYGVRATTTGAFTLGPAEISALYAPDTRARSTATSLTVVQ